MMANLPAAFQTECGCYPPGSDIFL